ncbi:MAG: hypothetical protein LBT46_13970 [Planctomycetaceae bacterium]|jgi:D-lyxose ketol-isomerase|nr:hypothetical protein [Planctomycetaceae bacterium]
MSLDKHISRRGMLGIAAAGLTAILTAEAAEAQVLQRRPKNKRGLQFHNEQFYKGGKFNEDAAKDAVLEFCRYHGYPVFPTLRERLWVSDYGLGKFTEVGLSAVGFANNLEGEYSYMLQDLFMLPHQMLPEHWHVKPEDTKKNGAQKNEAWVVRWGRSYIIGEGEANLPGEVVVPAVHGGVTVKHCTLADPGVTVKLSSLGSHHWQFAGAEGVILSEVANYHDNGSVRHQNKKANDDFLKSL